MGVNHQMNGQSEQSRRDILRAAGGFALAASGLFLPTFGDESEARNQKAQRRKRRQRRADRNAEANVSIPQREPFQLRGVALYIHNQRPSAVSVREWVFIGEPSVWRVKQDWRTIPAKPAGGPEPFLDLVDPGLQVTAELSVGHIIWGGNPPIGFPWVTIGTGGWSADGWQPKGEALIDKSFSVNDRFTARGFTAQRLVDSDDYIQFLINLT